MLVESSKKANTIQKLLGDNYEVRASGGHIRHMKKSGLGYNEKTFEIEYEMDENKKTLISAIRKSIKEKRYSSIILASDPDREGEAIAKAFIDELGLQESDYNRCTFNAITKDLILKAVNTAQTPIDKNLVI